MAAAKSGSLALALFGLAFFGVVVFMMIMGLRQALSQAYKLAHSLPVAATVVAAQVIPHRSKKSTSYRPLITFRYQADGREWQTDTVFPLEASFGNQAAAMEIVARHPPGSQATAWYDPTATGEAFLERRVDFMPYFGMIFPLLHFSIGLSLVLFALRPPGKDARSAFRRTTLVFAAWVLVMALATAHFLRSGGVIEAFSGGTLGVAWTLTLLLGWWWSRTYARVSAPVVAAVPTDA